MKWGEVPRGVFLHQVLCLNNYERVHCPFTLPRRVASCSHVFINRADVDVMLWQQGLLLKGPV